MKSFSATKALTSALEIAFLAAGTTIAAGAFNPTIAVISSAGTESAGIESTRSGSDRSGSDRSGANANNLLRRLLVKKVPLPLLGGVGVGFSPVTVPTPNPLPRGGFALRSSGTFIANNILNNTNIAFSFSDADRNSSPGSDLLLSHNSVYHIVEETIFDLLELPESMVTQDVKLQDLFAEAGVCDRQDTAQTTIRLLGILFEEFQVDLEDKAVLADLNEVETVADLTNLVLKYGNY